MVSRRIRFDRVKYRKAQKLYEHRRKSIRDKVFERDHYACVNCGSTENLTIDHIIPMRLGGEPIDLDNLQTLCLLCNIKKGAKMSKTILAEVDGFTPAIDSICREHGVITAVVFGRIWRYCQGKQGVCSASLETIAGDLGIDRATVMRHAKKLVELGYLIDITPGLRNSPHTYADTGKAGVSVKIGTVAQSNTVAESNTPVAECNKSVAESKLKKVTRNKEERFKRDETSVAAIPVANTTEEVIEHDNSTVVEEQEGESTEKENGRLYAVQQGQNPPDLENTETIEQSFDRQTKAQLKLPRMTAEEHKAMTLQSMVRGQEWSKETREYIRKRFLLNIKWEWKSSQEFLENIRREPPERTIQRFADWWYSEEWRGKQGQPPPSLEEIWKLWPRAFENVTPIREPYVDEYGAGHL